MEILIILGLILLNGVFSMAELALVSAKRVRLESRSAEGSQGAAVALKLADDPSATIGCWWRRCRTRRRRAPRLESVVARGIDDAPATPGQRLRRAPWYCAL